MSKLLKVDITGGLGSGKLALAEKIKEMIENDWPTVQVAIVNNAIQPLETVGYPNTCNIEINVNFGKV